MPDILNANGLQTKSLIELKTELETKMKTIYGNDINLDQDSPDAQLIGIFSQASVDIRELIIQVYNMFNPGLAVGRVLDQRVALNGIQRKGGTYTVQPVTVVTSGQAILYGLDQTAEEVYTVADDAGTEFQLAQTINIPTAGSYDLIFQAADPGKVEVQINTITNPVTIVLGVVSVTNQSAPVSVGLDEETDIDLRIRQQQSTAISSQGYNDALTAALFNVNGIEEAIVLENKTGADPDSRGIPSHSIWVIVSGVYNDADVAMAIYTKRNLGAGMKGDNTFIITQADGTSFTVQWDDVVLEDLFINLVISAIDPTKAVDVNAIRTGLPAKFETTIGGTVNINQLAAIVQGIDPNALVTSSGFAYDSSGPFLNKLTPTSLNKKFNVKAANVIITPMQIFPSNPSVIGGVTPESRTFLAYGGFGTYTWSIDVDNSGAGGTPASISSGGFYTPGSAHTNVQDTIKVVDSKGNIAYAIVEVKA